MLSTIEHILDLPRKEQFTEEQAHKILKAAVRLFKKKSGYQKELDQLVCLLVTGDTTRALLEQAILTVSNLF